MGWHSDNERVYGSAPTIASVSFGRQRDFVLRNNADHSIKYSAALGHGDLLVMRGSVQQFWQHQIPKRASLDGEVINLTFRRTLRQEDM